MESLGAKGRMLILQVGKSNSRGFTLIELTVVIFLIGLMFSIAVPKIREIILTDDLQKTVNYISNKSRELQSEALRSNVDYILVFDIEKRIFWVYSTDMTSEAISDAKNHQYQMPEGVTIADIYYLRGEKQVSGEATIKFFKGGYVQPAVLHLSKEGRSFTLIFEPFLNQVTAIETYVDYRFNGER